MGVKENKLLFAVHDVGVDKVYGLLTSYGVLLPGCPMNTRYRFACDKKTAIIIELAKRLQNLHTIRGEYTRKCFIKIQKCDNIINYYLNKYHAG